MTNTQSHAEKELEILVQQLQIKTQALLDSFKLGNVIKNGVQVAIVGKPNAGKSTLLNALLNENRALVSEIAGTTRDTVEEYLNIQGVLFKLIDTAGIRNTTQDVIEQMGIDKSKEKILGADIVIHSLTKYINGSSDTVGGVVCASQEFINDLKNVNSGASMLLGPTMDSMRSASVMKNLRTLHLRIKQHSHNAAYLAEKFEKDGLKTVYPGLKSHPSHEIYSKMINPEYGFGGMMTIDAGSLEKANALMELMQERNLGYLAVSLGFYKTLFSAPGTSTSSEIPMEEQVEMGLTDGLIRFSIGLDNDIERTYQMMKQCMKELNIL